MTSKKLETKRWGGRADWTDANDNANANQFVELKSDICLEVTAAGQENMTTLTRQDLNFGQGKTDINGGSSNFLSVSQCCS